MDEEFAFKLIQSVDPTKIRVPLKEKFAKLTLSSNKKKQAKKNEASPQETNAKRQSASRNLMQSFVNDDGGLQNEKKNTSAHIKPVNPLLQSDSSGTHDNDESILRVEGKFKEWENASDSSNFMEPLQLSVSFVETQDDAVEELSRRISSMVVAGNDTPHKLTPQRGQISDKLRTPQKTPRSAASAQKTLAGRLKTPQSAASAHQTSTHDAQHQTKLLKTPHRLASTPQKSYFEGLLKSPQNLTPVAQKTPQGSTSIFQKSLRESPQCFTNTPNTPLFVTQVKQRPMTAEKTAENLTKTPVQPGITSLKTSPKSATSQRKAQIAENPPTNSALHHTTSSEHDDDEDDDDVVIVPSTPSEGRSYDDTSDDVITISDTSIEAPAESGIDLEHITSSIPQSNSTGQSFLPSTFSNDKADRIEAFLRDVSQELKERAENSDGESDDEFHDASNVMPPADPIKKELSFTRAKQIANADTEPMSSEELSLSVEDYVRKAKKWATADTEPMTSEECSERSVNEPKTQQASLRDRETIADAEGGFKPREISAKNLVECRETLVDTEPMTLNDTEAMSQTHTTFFGTETQNPDKSSSVATVPRNYDTRFANDDTELNTMTSNMDAWRNSDVRPDNSLMHGDSISLVSNSPPRSVVAEEESIVISETSSEANTTTNTREIVVSEQTSKGDPSSLESQVSEMAVAMGTINISAKININIQVSHLDETESEASSTGTSRSSPPLDQADSAEEKTTDEHDDGMPEQSPHAKSAEEETELNNCCEQRQHPPKDVSDPASEESVVDEQFLTNAQRLLNKLYGTTWQTPEVIRTLHKTSASGKKTLPKRQLSTETPTRGKKSRTPRKLEAAVQKVESAKQQHEANKENLLNATAQAGEQSILLDEFSIFRREIVKTNLNSTRIMAPESTQAQTHFKVPKVSTSKPVYKTKSGRAVTGRYRNLVDSLASDEDAPNITDEPSSDEDYEIPQAKQMDRASRTRTRNALLSDSDEIVYLDLTHDEVVVKEGEPTSPLANNDPNFKATLEDLLRTCKPAEKPKLLSTTPAPKTKRKLFTPNFGYEDEQTPPPSGPKTPVSTPVDDYEAEVYLTEPLPQLNIFKKPMEEFKGTPIFKNLPAKALTPSATKGRAPRGAGRTPKMTLTTPAAETPCGGFKYGFLKSLEMYLDSSVCDKRALYYRENFRTKKEELSKLLYDLFNEKLFDNRLEVPLIWNKKLLNTAGRCVNRTKLGQRSSDIELSVKVLTSADRLRCTLVHEMCHAATWIFNGEGGHGRTWKGWAQKANRIFPELPKILVCHQYDIEYKYTYKCTLCAAKSHAHSKSKKVENIRCAYCHGAIEVFLNKKDKQGNVVPTPVKGATGFAKFVKDNYKQYKRPDLKHADVMKLLSNEFGALKLKPTS